METAHAEGKVLALGVSNCPFTSTFKKIYEDARVKPTVLQNKFDKAHGYDVQLRAFCAENKATLSH